MGKPGAASRKRQQPAPLPEQREWLRNDSGASPAPLLAGEVKKGSWFREAGDFQRSLLVERRRLNPGFFSFKRNLSSSEAAPGGSGRRGGYRNLFQKFFRNRVVI